ELSGRAAPHLVPGGGGCSQDRADRAWSARPSDRARGVERATLATRPDPNVRLARRKRTGQGGPEPRMHRRDGARTTEAHARALDAADPLAAFRERFYPPAPAGRACLEG